MLALGAALIAIYIRGADIMPLLPIFAAASIPALLGVFLARIADREWVQLLWITYWTKISGLAGLLAFGLATLFGAAVRRTGQPAQSNRTFWRDGVEGGLFEYDAEGRLVGTNKNGLTQ